jgi:hypothetical protein
MFEKWKRAGIPLSVAVIAMALIAGCRNINTKQAVKQAIDTHLQENSSINRSSFITEVEKVDFRGDTAQALVKFQSRQSPNLAVHVRYNLKRSRGQWLVMSSEPAGGQGPDSHLGEEPTGSGSPAPIPGSSSPAPVASH